MPAVIVGTVSAHDESSRPLNFDPSAVPGLAPAAAPGDDFVELIVDGESFVVTRRAGSSGSYDFVWTSHPARYGFGVSRNGNWEPSPGELTEQIRDFLTEIDPETGYLRE